MKQYPKIVQSDSRGQIVIPKDIRQELGIADGTGFLMYTVADEGILLKVIPAEPLQKQEKIIKELSENSGKVRISKANLDRSVKRYKASGVNRLEEI
ncbi:AbrB/MazE/SpoVT family DNA-binding domain-containing protein [Candidatus Woesearchaeota archaeon]|nr:AbrB/MazE/SpoVT family DNA-binding domain-containing protein [Candidatus Woesearchaeota archaeon]